MAGVGPSWAGFSLGLLLVLALCTTSLAKIENPVDITEDNFEELFESNSEWMLMFYAPWCPACQHLKPVWLELAGWQKDLEITVGQCDITKSPGLSGQFLIFGLPTIFHIKDGVTRQYKGTRDLKKFIAFIDDRQWESLEPVTWYSDPKSIQMRLVGRFFVFANKIRGLHTTLTEHYGLPTMLVYVLFGLATILAGLIIGMVIVYLCDCFCPTRGLSPEDTRWLQRKEADDEEELQETDESKGDTDEKRKKSKKTN